MLTTIGTSVVLRHAFLSSGFDSSKVWGLLHCDLPLPHYGTSPYGLFMHTSMSRHVHVPNVLTTCLSHPSIVSQPGDRPGAIVLATFENALARLPTLAVL